MARTRKDIFEEAAHLIACATSAKTPLELRKLLTIKEFSSLSGMSVTAARKALLKMNERSIAPILCNVSTGPRVRWRVSIDVLKRCAPHLIAPRPDALGLDRVETLESKVRRLEVRIERLLKQRPALAADAPRVQGWLNPTQMATLLGVPARTVGRVITDLGLRGDLPGLCERLPQKEREATIRNGRRPTKSTWIAFRYSAEAFERIRAVVEAAP